MLTTIGLAAAAGVRTSRGGLKLPTLLPGIRVNTSPTNYHPIRQLQLARRGSCSVP